MNLLVTFKAKESYKHIIENRLNNYVNIQYLDEETFENRKSTFSKCHIIFAWNISKELIETDYIYLKNCKFIQLLSAGANHVPFKFISDNITIASNVGAYAKPMAEHALGLILSLSKSLLPRHKELKKGIFNQSAQNKLVENLNCGILGFGGIGKAVAALFQPFNMKIFAINTSGSTDYFVNYIGTLKDLDYLLQQVDILIITLPLNKYTHNLINKDKLNLMKKDAILINIARGDIIVEEDLFVFLQQNPDFKAGLDAWWIEPFSHGFFKTNFPFFDLPNFLGSPHNSAIVPGIIEEAINSACSNIISFLSDKKVKGIVNRNDYNF
jgi:glycerate dehydrogenase